MSEYLSSCLCEWHRFTHACYFSATGLGIQLMPAIAIVKDWFDKRRPLALSINSAAIPIAIFAGPPLGQVSGKNDKNCLGKNRIHSSSLSFSAKFCLPPFCSFYMRAVLIQRSHPISIEIPIVKLRLSHYCLISMMEVPIPGKMVFMLSRAL